MNGKQITVNDLLETENRIYSELKKEQNEDLASIIDIIKLQNSLIDGLYVQVEGQKENKMTEVMEQHLSIQKNIKEKINDYISLIEKKIETE